MMPKRLAELDSDAKELERALLAASKSPEPGPGEQERVWQLLAANLRSPTHPDDGGNPGGPATPQTLNRAVEQGHPLVGLLVNHGIGFAVGVAVTTLAFLVFDPLRPTSTPTPPERASVEPKSAPQNGQTESPRSVPSSMAIDELELAAPGSGAKAKPRVTPELTPPNSEPAPQPASRLSEEAALIREARSRLAHGDLPGAGEVLALSNRRFPASLLEQEREAVTIELLRRRGDREAAATRARQFLSKYPRSPHARQVERALPASTND